MQRKRRALVLGGGGVAGIAWETGLLVGLREAGVDLGRADLLVGTSAGSVVGGLLRSGRLLAAWEGAMSEVEEQQGESAWDSSPDIEQFVRAAAAAAAAPAGSEDEARARLGALALQLSTEGQVERIAVFSELLGTAPGAAWPEGDFRVTAVDAQDGSFRTFESTTGVDCATAIAASCAVPLVYPTVVIGGRSYMDGGMRSATNADLADAAERVLVIACSPELATSALGPTLDLAVARLRSQSDVVVVLPDERSAASFGDNVLALSSQRPAAQAGYTQAAREADRIRAFWD
ncbi:patatin-like phospholipase family protein [Amnibacterium kyonggiense]